MPKDTLPKDILPKDTLPNGHFADGRFAERTFCRTDILPNGHFAERTVCRKDNLPKIEMLFRQNVWDCDSFGIYFKMSEKETSIDPDIVCEEIFPNF